MSNNYGLTGVNGTLAYSKKGPKIANESGNFALLDNAGTGLVKLRTADAVNNDEAVTLAQLNSAVSSAKDQTEVVFFTFSNTTVSLGTVPAGGNRIKGGKVVITTPFNGTNPSLTVGKTDALTELAIDAVTDLQLAGSYEIECLLQDYSDTEIVVTISAGGATVGSGMVQFYFEQDN